MEDATVKKLLNDVETQLNWDNSDLWTTHDFEELSEKILRETTVNLSVTTLKRLWGKISYESNPTITTLNTLAQYLGFKNWREYKQNIAPLRANNENGIINTEEIPEVNFTSKSKTKFLFIALTLLAVAFLFIYFFNTKNTSNNILKIDVAQFSFSSKIVMPVGVPNSVIFKYDASAAGVNDKVEFQQSWDERLRISIPRDKKIYNSIYYYPGYFKAKLLVADSVIKEEGILIKTDGWLTLIEKEDSKPPMYFKKEDIFLKSGVMALPIEKIKEVNMDMTPEPTWTTYFNINDFGSTSLSNNFLFETEVRNDYSEIAGICQYINIVLYFEGAMLYIPLSYMGCVSNLSVYDTNGLMDIDISVLGFEHNKWMKIKVEVINEKGKIYINNKFAYDFDFHFDQPEKFVGLKYNFQGTGSVKYTKFIDGNGKAIFNEVY